MAERSEKVPIARAGPDDAERCLPAVNAAAPGPGRLLKVGAAVLISGALLLLAGAIGAFYFWKATEQQVYNIHYTMSINGKVQDGSMEIDAGNNLETFKTGSGSEEAVEVHDFQIGITGIRFGEGEKCYIKAQPKARVPSVDAKASLSSQLEDEIMPVRFDENSLIWVAADEPIKHNSFLSSKILELCRDLPIFWLRPTYPPKDNQRREMKRNKRQLATNFDVEDLEAAIEEGNTRSPTSQLTQEPDHQSNETMPMGQETDETLNPDNPYNASICSEGMAFDPMLDHLGVCCIECRRSYTQCQRICEPLLGYHPWPYNYQGCRTACRIIMPCSWWVARIMGVV
ncbi:CNMD protein, partial [Rhinopomastus cyanomelas]|nr:CNMD protein [Rhinopomastus cyanomelas]